jgi:hypothetical protein
MSFAPIGLVLKSCEEAIVNTLSNDLNGISNSLIVKTSDTYTENRFQGLLKALLIADLVNHSIVRHKNRRLGSQM